jgi:hypothetical protein
MPCGEKVHTVREKWKRKKAREDAQREIETRKIAVPDWPTPDKIEKPAETSNGQS